ncbi:hypothetical protein [Stieleria varia]|uniref:Periplasmic repressor CpxP n=1 Tax=Stieleria varia TaxID=2528005 RepID=A0A5C6BB81_9BACT|nr:hypothetical protein [Stieleria varia]TWU08529.1 hypothetical protein Pla52n_11120 [Stieleria varia]
MRSIRWMTGLAALGLFAFLATDVMAQGGGRGPGGPGGRGGFGGGPPGGFGRGGGDMSMGLLRIDAVKKELELMPDQEEALKKLEAERPERGERPNFDFQNATDEERQAFFDKRMKEQEEQTAKMREKLEEVLFPEQIDRLDEIALQLQGIMALSNPKVQKELEITEAQQKEMTEKRDGMREKMRGMMQEAFQSGDRDKIREMMTKAQKDSETELLGVLTSDQKAKFEKMKGEKFEMPEGQGFGGFGRGGPGGGPGGPGGQRGQRGGDRGQRGGGDRPAAE